MPAVIPVTIPVVPMDALPLLMLHVPPPVASLSEVVRPLHTPVVPDMVAGNAPTVTTDVVLQPVDNK